MENQKFSAERNIEAKVDLTRRRALSFKSDKIPALLPSDKVERVLRWTPDDFRTGRYRIKLYRFLADHIPLINACIWTWARLTGAPGKYQVTDCGDGRIQEAAQKRLNRLFDNVYSNVLGNRTGMTSLLPQLFSGLFRDGLFGGVLTVKRDFSGVDRFIPINAADICYENDGTGPAMFLEFDTRKMNLDRPDFYYLSLSNSIDEPLGRSILKTVPFISYIEQQLVNDMQKSSHNSGYHRLHVKITPPERMSGESDNAYTERINGYFDATVRMIKDCEVDDNPVTWDNVAIEYIGPGKTREVTNGWFMNHRAVIEDICAGTNLAPYLLGYSYGATTTWSNFKFDVVMRQVRSVQAEVARFLEWVGNVDLALGNFDVSCRFVFDNSFAYQAVDKVTVESSRVDNILKLYQAGLLDRDTAAEHARELL
ncbi:MAG: hypothetical protein ACOYVF_01160 [Candidatus Zixiibacteriota bacterium]